MSAVRVLIADDQALVRAGFRMILDAEDDLDVVGEASDGLQAVEQAKRLSPDVVLMDIRMPELDGIEATRRVLAAGDGAKVLMLTTFDLNEYVYDALRAGASGFLLKDVPPEQLADGIRVVARRRRAARALDHPPPDPGVRPGRPALRPAARRASTSSPPASSRSSSSSPAGSPTPRSPPS